MIPRELNILKSNSFLLLGPRGTGKTRLVKHLFEDAVTVNLLDPDVYERFLLNPNELRNLKASSWIFIDEIQKVPALLDIVHDLIEKTDQKFALTGSSAKKLKRGGANLLAGRAFSYQLFPFTSSELGERFDLDQVLQWGSLPKVCSFDSNEEKKLFLQTYFHTYIQEEIIAEQLVRQIEPFRKFVYVAAQMNGKIINFSKIARDVGITDITVKSHFQLLEDTLLGFFLPSYHTSIRKQQRSSSKFYFFDLGVQRAITRSLTVPLVPQTYAYGKAFEHFIILELSRLIAYLRNDFTFSYLKLTEQLEIDLVIERPGKSIVIIEIKSSNNITEDHVRALVRYRADFPGCEAICISTDPFEKEINGITCLPWQKALKKILE